MYNIRPKDCDMFYGVRVVWDIYFGCGHLDKLIIFQNPHCPIKDHKRYSNDRYDCQAYKLSTGQIPLIRHMQDVIVLSQGINLNELNRRIPGIIVC